MPHTEIEICAKHILATVEEPRIGALMRNGDYGKDCEGFKAGLGGEVQCVVKPATYEITVPTVDSQVIQIRGSDANVFSDIASPNSPPRRCARWSI